MGRSSLMGWNWIAYSAAAFAVSGIFCGLLRGAGGVHAPHFILWAKLLMWTPGALALLFIDRSRRSFLDLGWKIPSWRYVVLALLFPPMLHLSAMSLLIAMGFAHLAEPVARLSGGLIKFSASIFVRAVLAAPLLLLFTLGEEIGWRGYLQPRLSERHRPWLAIAATGLLWGFWHAPLIWMGFNFPDHPRLGALVLMPLLCVGVSGFLGWLYLRSRSIWIPALAHAAMNSSGWALMTLEPVRGTLWLDVSLVLAWNLMGAACLIRTLSESKDLRSPGIIPFAK